MILAFFSSLCFIASQFYDIDTPLSPLISASTMNSGPGLLSNFGKKTKALLMRDYQSDQKISVSTTSVTGVTLTSSATNKGGESTGDVGAMYKHKNTLINVKFDAQSNITMTLTLKDIAPSTNTTASFKLNNYKSSKIATTLTSTDIFFPSTKAIASLELPDFRSGKLDVHYFHHHATLTSTVALNHSPTINISATIGTPIFAMGAKVGYETPSSKFTNFTVGISVNIPDSTSSIVLSDKGDTIRASYIHHFDRFKKTAVAGEFTRRLKTNKTRFTIGGCYAVDGQTMVKAKLTNHGKLSVLLKHEIIPKSFVTLSSELDSQAFHKIPRFGLALVLKH
ncbi:mitochondrial outer membrane protein porin 2 [Lactuca sativa]|uniref:Mitochondrial outer membrane protein porin 2-like n=1 Tax=Lactuca sativa TaxID=4236 RepID=A0A9R1WFG9_LACSA|nr:mitochondrial outer membrane protein porin 2 [Lactuca sativa]KAJ0221832.1 hypothetical protein LSAT_V11C200080330 [Lactuca sativa]